jgi:hypothetical protein
VTNHMIASRLTLREREKGKCTSLRCSHHLVVATLSSFPFILGSHHQIQFNRNLLVIQE